MIDKLGRSDLVSSSVSSQLSWKCVSTHKLMVVIYHHIHITILLYTIFNILNISQHSSVLKHNFRQTLWSDILQKKLLKYVLHICSPHKVSAEHCNSTMHIMIMISHVIHIRSNCVWMSLYNFFCIISKISINFV